MLSRVAFAGLMLVLGAANAFSTTTGQMRVTVRDSGGTALPGATVAVDAPTLMGGPLTAVTGADGEAAFHQLPVGTYRVEARKAGLKPVGTNGVPVTLDRVARVLLSLAPENAGEEMEGAAVTPVLDTSHTSTGVIFEHDYLQGAAVGSGGRDYRHVIRQAAGVAANDGITVFGGTAGDNRYLVDGLNTTDPLLGTSGTHVIYDAIQDISFLTAGFEAELGQATGGIVNLVTRSGGNELAGAVDARYRDQSFLENGDHFDRDLQTSSARIISGTLGGPILRDRLWFFAALENSADRFDRDWWPVGRELDGWHALAKATWQLSDSHRAAFGYAGDTDKLTGEGSGAYLTREATTTEEQNTQTWQAQLSSVLSEKVLVNAQAGVVRGHVTLTPTYADDVAVPHFNQDTGIYSEAPPSSSDEHRSRDELRATMSLLADDFVGAHELKLGGDYDRLLYDSADWITGTLEACDRDRSSYPSWQDLNGDGYITEQS